MNTYFIISHANSLDHGSPTFCLAWTAVSEEEFALATHKIYNVVKVCKQQNFIF